ncbi:MAG: DUF2079 domain-containing protein [Candidatus Eremiobacteraeota bacterium]|nr:DUF2079 domain-containing protein [Candidatus Eremiobacteraeota bacterium]
MRDRVLWTACVMYAAVLFALGVVKYEAHRSLVDLGIFTQTAANAFGCFCNPIEGSHWAFHFSPVLYVAGAAIAVWHSPLALTLLQAIAGALCAPPVYALVRQRAPVAFARICAAIVLLYPPLLGLIFNDFHENGFAPAAALWLLWAFTTRRLALTVVLAALVLGIKEDQAVFLAFAGMFAFIAFRTLDPVRARLALAISGFSVAVLMVFFFVIQPHAAANPYWNPGRFYAWSGADFAHLGSGLLARAGFIVLVFLPLLFMPLRVAPILLALPPLAEVLFSRMPTTYTLGSHYAGAWAGYVLFAFALAMAKQFVFNERKAWRIAWWCVALCALELAVANPMHPRMNLHVRSADDRRLDIFLATIPVNISVATHEEAYTHLAATHPNATLLPEDSQTPIAACYVLIDDDYSESPRVQESRTLVQSMVRRGELKVERREGSISLYKRSGC